MTVALLHKHQQGVLLGVSKQLISQAHFGTTSLLTFLPGYCLLQARPEAIKALQSTAQGYLAWASSTEPRYAHITPEERAPIATEAQAALNWLSK